MNNNDDENIQFYKLPPVCDEDATLENKIYNQALDYAFSQTDVRDIAIMGPYGSGKSTVWKVYEKYDREKEKQELKNIITVSLADFKQSYENINEKFVVNDQTVENQIINQIAAQVNSKEIPLSKYQYIYQRAFNREYFGLVFIVGIVLVLFLKIKTLNLVDVIALVLLLMTFLGAVLYVLTRSRMIHLHKVNVQGVEAEFTSKEENETPINKEIREIVYMLVQSQTNTVVFEDLDRLEINYIKLFEKLRNLNFVLNSYLKANDHGHQYVRFVYLLREGTFTGDDRLKFFDFIVPVVPFSDSSNEKINIRRLLKQEELEFDHLDEVFQYVTDMRMVKNIVNEFHVYYGLLSKVNFNIRKDKLLAMMVLKNVIPEEFEDLQRDQGCIYNVFQYLSEKKSELEEERELDRNIYGNEIEQFAHEFNKLIEHLDESKYSIEVSGNKDGIEDVISGWLVGNQDKHQIVIRNMDGRVLEDSNCNLTGFLNLLIKYQITTGEMCQEILNSAKKHRKAMKDYIVDGDVTNETYEEVREGVKYQTNSEELEKLIEKNTLGKEWASEKNKRLVFSLIKKGFIDYDYKVYLGYFYYYDLSAKDYQFLKDFYDSNVIVSQFAVELDDPKAILKYIPSHLYTNIKMLNITFLKYWLDEIDDLAYQYDFDLAFLKNIEYSVEATVIHTYTDDIIQFTKTLLNNLITVTTKDEINNQVSHFIQSVEKNMNEKLKRYIQVYAWILGKKNGKLAGNILALIENVSQVKEVHECFLVNSLSSSDGIDLKMEKDIELEDLSFFQYLPDHSLIIDYVMFNFDENRIKIQNINFKTLSMDQRSKEKAAISIASHHVFVLNISNLFSIIDVLSHNYYYVDLFNLLDYRAIKQKLPDQLDELFSHYINAKKVEDKYKNSSEFVVDLLNSNIDQKLKKKYLENNETAIDKPDQVIKDQELVTFYKNTINENCY